MLTNKRMLIGLDGGRAMPGGKVVRLPLKVKTRLLRQCSGVKQVLRVLAVRAEWRESLGLPPSVIYTFAPRSA